MAKTLPDPVKNDAASLAPVHAARSRRHFVLGALSVWASACRSAHPAARRGASSAADPSAPVTDSQPVLESGPAELALLEAKVGGRLGLFAVDTASGRSIERRPDERFALCSTFKWILAAEVLRAAERGQLSLEERISFGVSDLLDHAPVTRARVGEGALTARELARAAVVVSDNTAANLLLARLGGPSGLTAFVREHGDPTTRLDRNEPTLNENAPGDPRDTTSPRAMLRLLESLLCGGALQATSQQSLRAWLSEAQTGQRRLRAGLPAGWEAGDKTGTGQRGAVGDVAIAWPRGRSPVLIVCYLSDSEAELSELEAAHAEAARIVVRSLVG